MAWKKPEDLSDAPWNRKGNSVRPPAIPELVEGLTLADIHLPPPPDSHNGGVPRSQLLQALRSPNRVRNAVRSQSCLLCRASDVDKAGLCMVCRHCLTDEERLAAQTHNEPNAY